ncbi:nuclear pore complex protein NUP98A-like [Macadamia integrifolia]|uniref:nuclear pore complex protein NUP98A-like n=1 Tax=Macadamia integrifolia TaxID=60698 RepID=UPI001C4F6950|nr:nuclear pore complex protein NUP98A-like [Macadamia integrifolia]
MFDWSQWNKNLDESPSNMPLGSSTSDSSRLGLGDSSTPAAIGNSSFSLFPGFSMTGQKPIGFGCNPFPIGNPYQTTQEASGNNIFGPKPTSGAFIQPATSQQPGLDASSSQAFGFAAASAFGSTGTTPFVSSAPAFGFGGAVEDSNSISGSGSPASSFCGSFRIALKCATCGSFDWIPHVTQPQHPLFGSTQPLGGSSQSLFAGSITSGSLRIGLKCATCGGFDWVPHLTQPHQHLFHSTTQPLVGSSQPKFASSKTPGFGTTTCFPTRGVKSNPTFGPPTTSTFGSLGTTTCFSTGATSNPTFGTETTSTFGSKGTAFALSSASTSEAVNKPVFGSSTTTAFGSSSALSFSISITPAFSSVESTPFGSSPSLYGVQNSPSVFPKPDFGGQGGGSRVAPYSPLVFLENRSSKMSLGKLMSISAVPTYNDKSHEELRWEDYKLGDKGGSGAAAQSIYVRSTSS